MDAGPRDDAGGADAFMAMEEDTGPSPDDAGPADDAFAPPDTFVAPDAFSPIDAFSPVDAHLTHIYRKLDINTRARLAALVMEQSQRI